MFKVVINKLTMNITIAIGLLVLSILFAFMSDWADNRTEGYSISAVEMVGFLGALGCLVGAGFAIVAAYWEWIEHDRTA